LNLFALRLNFFTDTVESSSTSWKQSLYIGGMADNTLHALKEDTTGNQHDTMIGFVNHPLRVLILTLV
jgi:hypothetical protein